MSRSTSRVWRPGARGRAAVRFLRGLACLCALLLLCLAPRAEAATPYDPAGPYADSYRAGEYRQAIEELEAAITGELGLPPVLWAADHAELLFTVGRYEEALAVLGDVVRRVYEPRFTVRLAEMYRLLGRYDDADDAIGQAIQQNRARFRQDYPRENLLAIAKVARMRGENPRSILQIFRQRLLERSPDFVPGFEAAAELALENYGYDVAERYFQQALALDANRQSALAGLAETYYQAGDPRFEEIAGRLLDLNPNHPRVRIIQIERALMAADVERAEALLDGVLAVNPAHHAGLAYRAAAAFLADNHARQAASLEELAALNPDSAEGYRILGDLAARRYRFEEAVAFLREGLQRDPENNGVKASLGLNLLRLGEDDTGRVILEEVFEEDPFNVQVYNMLEVLDTLDGFETVKNDEFHIRLPALEAAVMGPELLALLGEALARYEDEYDASVQRPVYVQLFDDHDDFMVRSVGLPGNAGHLGICFGNLVTLDSPRARDPRSMNWRSVLWHEFVHVITLQKTGNRIPRWLSEGISVHEESQKDPAWGQPLDPNFRPILTPGEWPAMEDLEGYFVQPESPGHLMAGYFLAGAFVDAYVAAHGKPALVSALDAIGGGDEARAALVAAAGGDARALNAMFAEHLEQVCAPLQYLPSPGGETGDPDGDTFPALIEAGLAARDAGRVNQAIEHFEAAAALFPAISGASNPVRQLAAIRRDTGDLEQWYQAVRRLQHHDPAAYEAPFDVMKVLEEAGEWPRVLALAGWCIGIDPFDVAVYASRRRAQAALGDNAGLLETLDHLAELDAAQAESYRLAKGRTLRSMDRDAEARELVLTLLESYPEYREAQQLLLELHEQGVEVAREDS